MILDGAVRTQDISWTLRECTSDMRLISIVPRKSDIRVGPIVECGETFVKRRASRAS